MEAFKEIGWIFNRGPAGEMVTAVTIPLCKGRSEAPRLARDLIKMRVCSGDAKAGHRNAREGVDRVGSYAQ